MPPACAAWLPEFERFSLAASLASMEFPRALPAAFAPLAAAAGRMHPGLTRGAPPRTGRAGGRFVPGILGHRRLPQGQLQKAVTALVHGFQRTAARGARRGNESGARGQRPDGRESSTIRRRRWTSTWIGAARMSVRQPASGRRGRRIHPHRETDPAQTGCQPSLSLQLAASEGRCASTCAKRAGAREPGSRRRCAPRIAWRRTTSITGSRSRRSPACWSLIGSQEKARAAGRRRPARRRGGRRQRAQARAPNSRRVADDVERARQLAAVH